MISGTKNLIFRHAEMPQIFLFNYYYGKNFHLAPRKGTFWTKKQKDVQLDGTSQLLGRELHYNNSAIRNIWYMTVTPNQKKVISGPKAWKISCALGLQNLIVLQCSFDYECDGSCPLRMLAGNFILWWFHLTERATLHTIN